MDKMLVISDLNVTEYFLLKMIFFRAFEYSA